MNYELLRATRATVGKLFIFTVIGLLQTHSGWSQTPLWDKMDKEDRRRPVLFDDIRMDRLISLQDTVSLSLSELQHTQINRVNNEYRIKIEAVRKSIVEKKIELADLEKSKASWRLINKKINQLSVLLGQEIKINTKHRIEVKEILTE